MPVQESDLSRAGGSGPAGPSTAGVLDAPADLAPPYHRALAFLEAATDAATRGPGSAISLVQSYTDQAGLGRTAFLYDNALAILAYLADGRADPVRRARGLGDALLYAQDHDPEHRDGRLRHAYRSGPDRDGFVRPDGSANVASDRGFGATAVGDLAWAGIALCQLARRTRRSTYGIGARRVGEWIESQARSSAPLGGYSGGLDQAGNPLLYTSTEHNISCVALFGQLARLTGDRVWRRRRDHAASFLTWTWSAAGGFFHTGSDDGATVNDIPVPEDTQSWSYLALAASRYQSSVDWATSQLAVTDTADRTNSALPAGRRFAGVTFSSASRTATETTPIGPGHPRPDRSAVWFEGNAHLATALRQRRRPGDEAVARGLLAACEDAQDHLGADQTMGGQPLPARSGVVSASSPLDTGYGFGYYPYRHVGATAWYLLASARANPLEP